MKSVSITTDLEKKIADAFLIFDHQGNKTVDVREIGTILRYLGCVPSENEINEIISATEFEDSNGTIHLSRFLPHVTQLLAEHKYINYFRFFAMKRNFASNNHICSSGWRPPHQRNCWRHFAFLMSMAKESFRETILLSWWWKRANHSRKCDSIGTTGVAKYLIENIFFRCLGGIRRNDGHSGRHTIRRHSIWILHQFTDGKFQYS